METHEFRSIVKTACKDAYRDAKMKIHAYKLDVVKEVYADYLNELETILKQEVFYEDVEEYNELQRTIRLWLEIELDDAILDS